MEKKLIFRILCLMFALTLLLSVAAGCKPSKTTDKPTDSVNGSGEPGDNLSLVPDADMRGRDFLMLSDFDATFLINESDGDPIHDTEFERTLYLQDRFNVKLKMILLEAGNYAYDALQKTSMVNQKAYDLIYPHPTVGMGVLFTTDILSNLADLDILNLDKPWYNQSQVNNYMANGKLYITATETSITGQAFSSVIYNRELYKDFAFEEDLYQVVNDKKWTIELLTQMVIDSKVIDEGGGTPSYGLTYWSGLSHSVMIGMGQDIFRKNVSGEFELAFDADKLTTIAEALSKLLYETDNVFVANTNNAGLLTSQLFQNFKNGNALFMNYDIGSMSHLLRDLEFNIGYLPNPLLVEGEEYRVFCASGFFAIPKLLESIEESSIILEAMSIYSYEFLRPVFIKSILIARMSDSAEDFQMLEFMHEKKHYDLGFTYDNDNHARYILHKIVVEPGAFGGTRAVSIYLRAHSNYLDGLAENANTMQ